MQMVTVGHVYGVIDVFMSQFFAHVTDGEDMNTRRDECDHHKHHQSQTVDVIIDSNIQIAEFR